MEFTQNQYDMESCGARGRGVLGGGGCCWWAGCFGERGPPCGSFFPQLCPFFFFFIFGVAVPLHANWTLSGNGVNVSISVDDSHLLLDVPSDYPERNTSVEPEGVQPEMVLTGSRPMMVGGGSGRTNDCS